MLSPNVFGAARVLGALALALAGLRHTVLALSGEGNVARHWVFVPINLVVAVLLVARPRLAFFPVLAFTVQQMWSHGLDLARSFNGNAPVDKLSLAVCLFFPTLATILFIERQEDAGE